MSFDSEQASAAAMPIARSLPTTTFHNNHAQIKQGTSVSLASSSGLAFLDLPMNKKLKESPLTTMSSRMNAQLMGTPTSQTSFANESENQASFNDKMLVSLDEPVGSLSISPRNRDVCLGASVLVFRSSMASPQRVARIQTQRTLCSGLAKLL